MSARTKSPWLLGLEFFPARVLFGVLRALPLQVGRRYARLLLQALIIFIPSRSQLIRTQIERCFPERTPAECRKIAQKSIQCLADGLATFAHIPDLCRKGIEDLVTLHGAEHIERAYQLGRGMITFTAHYGCWELMAVYITQRYPRVSMVVRPLDNPRVNDLIAGVRSSGGGGVIDSRQVLRQGIRLLRSNGILGVLVDQNFYKGGVFVDFFGRPAATNTLVPLLARRTDCVVLPMYNYWEGGKLHIVCEPPMEPSSGSSIFESMAMDTQRITAKVESWIRQDPTQWLWLHRRWKRRPKENDPMFSFTSGLSVAKGPIE